MRDLFPQLDDPAFAARAEREALADEAAERRTGTYTGRIDCTKPNLSIVKNPVRPRPPKSHRAA
jgi:hypothetical protein